ncbi:MAG TPA: MarR family transcriptional regulator [Longimicrobium sp.]|nr:MarR family transcriptional regulator [Longimicrobium sp.]
MQDATKHTGHDGDARVTTTMEPRTQHDPATEAGDFHRALRDLIRLHQLRDRDRVCCYDVTVSGAHALEILATQGPLSLNALAAELFVDKSTASRVVGCLEERGYVRRVPDPLDGRAIRVELTDAGADMEAQLRDDAVWEMQAMLAGFDPEVRRGMLGFLRQLTRTSATHAGATDASCCRTDPGAD